MIEAVFRYRALSRPNAAPLHAGGKKTMTARGVLMDAQRVFSGPQWIHRRGG